MINSWLQNIQLPEWPWWAVSTFLSLSAGCVFLATAQALGSRLQQRHVSSKGQQDGKEVSGKQATLFRRFQLKYLAVYLLVMLADWLQGTNMYTLYQSYGVNVGTLFLTGFSSSAIFGTFVGLFVDKFGRRAGCMTFCVLELVINTLEHFPNMRLLLLGRVLGGVSTSLLFSAFESWMVSQHRVNGFPEEWLSSTFSVATVGNGLMAVVAGVVAQLAADGLGDIGPFQVALALTLLALLLLCTWEENAGAGHGATATEGNGGNQAASEGLRKSVGRAWRCINTDPRVLLLGLIQSLFEGAMYTFVFMWVPTMQAVVPDGKLPLGLVFASFMVCITIGGLLFSSMIKFASVEVGSVAIFGLASLSMALPIYSQDFHVVLGSFLVLETCVGAFYSCSGLMRSKYLPDALQSSIMNIFRLPLNVLVVVGTRMTSAAASETVFTVISLWFATAVLLQLRLARITNWGETESLEKKAQ